MKKVILNLDEQTGQVQTDGGFFIGSLTTDQIPFVVEADDVKTKALIELKKAGFTVDEIIQLDQRGLL